MALVGPVVAQVLVGFVGCSHDPDQLVLTGGGARASEPMVDAFPDHGRLSYTDRPACLSCFRERCQPEADKCGEAPECATGVDCLRDCQQPTCFVRCYAKQQAVDPAPLAIGYSPKWGAMELCRDDRCSGPCEHTVDHYGCIGEYDWADGLTGHEGQATLHVRIADLETLKPYPDLDVAVCSGDPVEPCSGFDRAATNAEGRATLSYPVGVPGSVRNYLTVRDPSARVIPMILYAPRGLFVPEVHYPMLTTTAENDGFAPYRDWDKNRYGALMLVALYCDGSFAPDWSFEFEGSDEEGHPFRDGPNAAPGISRAGIGFASNIDPGQRMLVVHRVDTGETIARRSVRIEAGTSTLVWVLPPDRVEQAALDRP
ncbi:MAG: hypothetical protein OXR73_27555 [Myxococcales bacterium]|nr:hypothetical protein [Myxococcales bacterium]